MKIMRIGPAALLVSVILLAACVNTTRTSDVDVAGRDLPTLFRSADVVVVGTVVGEAGTVNTARNPNDITRPHPSIESIAQLYTVRVEEALKGEARGQLTVAVSRWSKQVGSGNREDWPQFIAFQPGQRYALFLRLMPQPVGPYYVVAEPGRFKLNAQAATESPWRHAPEVFPNRDVGEFLAELRSVKAP